MPRGQWRPLAPMIEQLGVMTGIGEHERITECVVVAKIVDMEEGGVALGVYTSDGLDWIAKRGLLNSAAYLTDATTELRDD